MNCERSLELIGPYVDGELDLSASLDVERHLEECPTCQQAHRRLHRLKASVTAGAPYYKAPIDFADQIRSHAGFGALATTRIPPQNQDASASHRFSWRLLATAAVLMLGISIAGIIVWQNHNAGVDALSRELVSAHVRSTQADHLLDVVSTDQHTVKPWFSGKLDFSPPVRDLAAAGFALEGGRLDYIAGRPVAALIYRHNKHVINCFVWPSDRTDSPASATAFQGYALVQFNQNGLTWHLVSDASRETLEQLARGLQTPIN